MTRHKWADFIHLWAEGAKIEYNNIENPDDYGWLDDNEPCWHSENLKFRIKPKESAWWENMPEHGVLCWVSDIDETTKTTIERITFVLNEDDFFRFQSYESRWKYATPLTNEEIEEFKR